MKGCGCMGNYINTILSPGEEIVTRGEVSKAPVIPGIILDIIIVILVLILTNGEPFVVTFGLVVLLVAIASFLTILPLNIKRSRTDLCITNMKIFGKTGIFVAKIINSPLDEINNVIVVNNFLGNLFNYATIIVTSKSDTIDFKYIKNASDFKFDLMKQIDIYKKKTSVKKK